MHTAARNAITKLLRQNEVLQIVPQNIYEGWVVATRPATSNGLGLSPSAVDRLIARTSHFCQMLPDHPNLYTEWLRLVTTYTVVGVNAHDARLVAAMKVYSIQNLITFNDSDFKRFADKEITIVSPLSL